MLYFNTTFPCSVCSNTSSICASTCLNCKTCKKCRNASRTFSKKSGYLRSSRALTFAVARLLEVAAFGIIQNIFPKSLPVIVLNLIVFCVDAVSWLAVFSTRLVTSWRVVLIDVFHSCTIACCLIVRTTLTLPRREKSSDSTADTAKSGAFSLFLFYRSKRHIKEVHLSTSFFF